MSTKRALIEQALSEFGITSSFDIEPEELQRGLVRLDRMAAQWATKSITGYDPAAGLEDESGVAAGSENAYALNLAVQWAGTFGKTVSQDTRIAAKNAWGDLYVSMQLRPIVPRSPALPVGTGNKPSVIGQQFFPETTGVDGLGAGSVVV